MKFAPLALVVVLSVVSGVAHSDSEKFALATFGGGCFWCMESPFDKLEGVISTTSGFSGGHVVNPSYKQVVTSNTGHTEVVQVAFDPVRVSYQTLLAVYWKNIDPLDNGGQFCDRGWSYRPVIFVHDDEQQKLAEESRDGLGLDDEIVVPIERYKAFYGAEGYHQDYYQKNPIRYKFYRFNCGRDQRLHELWSETSGH